MTASNDVAAPDAWSNAYIGWPFLDGGRTEQGIDCYGLLAFVYQRELGVFLPSYNTYYEDTEDVPGMDRIFAIESARAWVQVNAADRRPFDVIRSRFARLTHVMIYVEDGKALHTMDGLRSSVERIDTRKWLPRISGYYRHAKCPL